MWHVRAMRSYRRVLLKASACVGALGVRWQMAGFWQASLKLGVANAGSIPAHLCKHLTRSMATPTSRSHASAVKRASRIKLSVVDGLWPAAWFMSRTLAPFMVAGHTCRFSVIVHCCQLMPACSASPGMRT